MCARHLGTAGSDNLCWTPSATAATHHLPAPPNPQKPTDHAVWASWGGGAWGRRVWYTCLHTLAAWQQLHVPVEPPTARRRWWRQRQQQQSRWLFSSRQQAGLLVLTTSSLPPHTVLLLLVVVPLRAAIPDLCLPTRRLDPLLCCRHARGARAVPSCQCAVSTCSGDSDEHLQLGSPPAAHSMLQQHSQ